MYAYPNEAMETAPEVLGKYKLMLAMKSLDYEIRELTGFSKSCCECYVLLKDRINMLCSFMTDDDNAMHWRRYGAQGDVQLLAERLRESSVQALCDMEKYHSSCICDKKQDVTGYLSTLSESVKSELFHFGINENSRVLFIGSGAFPLSSFTIARVTGASVLGVDIDAEAVQLANRIAQAFGLHDKVKFTGKRISELTFTQEATHVIIASLVKNKLEVLDELQASIHSETQVILRYGNGLKSVFNYPLEASLEDEWISSSMPSYGTLYDTIILKKRPYKNYVEDKMIL